jgi:hypothetical protein
MKIARNEVLSNGDHKLIVVVAHDVAHIGPK